MKDPSWPDNLYSKADLENLPGHIKQELNIRHDGVYNRLVRMFDVMHNLEIRGVMPVLECLDRARDGHHFDIITSEWIVNQVMSQW